MSIASWAFTRSAAPLRLGRLGRLGEEVIAPQVAGLASLQELGQRVELDEVLVCGHAERQGRDGGLLAGHDLGGQHLAPRMAFDGRADKIGQFDGVAAGIGGRARRPGRPAHRVKLQALLHRQGPREEVEQIDAAVGGRTAQPRPPLELFDLAGNLVDLVFVAGQLQDHVLQIGVVGVELHLGPGLLQGPCLGRLGAVGRPLGPQFGRPGGKTQKQGGTQTLKRPAMHRMAP